MTSKSTDVSISLLSQQILRDSMDPGAAYILGAGARLPPPTTLHDVFTALAQDHRDDATKEMDRRQRAREHRVSVLILQGQRDPLQKDNVERAQAIAQCAAFVDQCRVVMLPALGHCPMDEDSEEVSAQMRRWYVSLASQRRGTHAGQ